MENQENKNDKEGKNNKILYRLNDYAYDLDRFIEGQIRFEDIQGYIPGDIPIQGAIIGALQEVSYYSEEEHDL